MEILALILFILCALILSNMNQVRVMSKPENLLKPDELAARDVMSRLPQMERSWIEENGYEFHASYRFQQIQFCVWLNRVKARYVVVYTTPSMGMVYDFESFFVCGSSLTTCINGQVGMFPLPEGSYKESLSCKSLAELDHAHEKSISVLRDGKGLILSKAAPDFHEDVAGSIKKEMEHVKSLFLWQIRSLYWFFVKRHTMRGKTIEDQIHKGWI